MIRELENLLHWCRGKLFSFTALQLSRYKISNSPCRLLYIFSEITEENLVLHLENILCLLSLSILITYLQGNTLESEEEVACLSILESDSQLHYHEPRLWHLWSRLSPLGTRCLSSKGCQLDFERYCRNHVLELLSKPWRLQLINDSSCENVPLSVTSNTGHHTTK